MPQSPPLSRLRLVGRLSVALLLDLVQIGRLDREFLDGVLLLTIVQANIGPLTRDTDLQRTYGDYDAPPPDELRRRVSVSAIARSLRLPYETARRHIARLAAAGECEVTPQGVYVPAATLHSPRHREAVIGTCELLRDFYFRLRELDALADLPAAEPAAALNAASGAPVRAIVRISSDYVLRMVDLLAIHVGDLVRGLILLAVLRANTEDLTAEVRGRAAEGPDGFTSDAMRRPVRVAELSARLGVPEETVRRHAARLVKDRLCVRGPDGLVLPSHVLARPQFVQLMADNHANVARMFAALARLGVIAEWERQRAASGG
ncbi:hypothetical protein [Phenylobacterium sp.]|uniref:hypothetical protein n=1 Tax=Phenylobacterium sp. TaxID=1871053 RepID=UPI002FE29CA5